VSELEPSATVESIAAAALEPPLPWVPVDRLAAGRPRYVVSYVVADELRRGRIERDGAGNVRLRAGALPPDVVAALAALEG
jgi:hypothetical protein